MGYTKSPKAIERVKNHLQQLLDSNVRIEWKADDPAKLAYYIHEAFHAAEYHAVYDGKNPLYVQIAQLKQKFSIRQGPGKVIAEPKAVSALVAVRSSLGRMVLADLTDTLEVIGAAMQHKAEEMTFPNASSEDIDLEAVYKWSAANGYYLIPSTAGITLTKNEEAKEIAWTPPEA